MLLEIVATYSIIRDTNYMAILKKLCSYDAWKFVVLRSHFLLRERFSQTNTQNVTQGKLH